MTDESLYPLGSTWDGGGVHFALFSENAIEVELCLFESASSQNESRRITLEKTDNNIWRVYVPEIGPGALYGYRVHGPDDWPHRFNPAKVLIDPYARSLDRAPEIDNTAFAPLCKVVDSTFDWQDDRPPKIPWPQTVIYETHVKGMTMRCPDIPEKFRGTYQGLASPAIIEHLTRLGVTTVELLPIQQKMDEYRLHANGLTNYWGYNTLLFFAPEIQYAIDNPALEFKEMVRAFHSAGIEIILDVVYNHSAEGDELGPTLSFRGIDNAVYYRLDPNHPDRYTNFTGCGNTLNLHHPAVLQLVMDSLRYWVNEMHVDGFRFDLATVLARGESAFEATGPFFQAIENDPVLSRVKLIAEPWDLDHSGYQLSKFPRQWSEWNDQYKISVRSFWKGDPNQTIHFARRLAGSGDIFQSTEKGPRASVNFITSHDGFTLHDLVSYENKHNEANKENNHDGSSNNHSCNYGAEGETDDETINTLRKKQKRNLIASLLISLGTPMINGGDEIGRTQQGNNNPYCQDNETTWFDWQLDDEKIEFLEFFRRMIELRKNNSVFQHTKYPECSWLSSNGEQMTDEDWQNESLQCLGWIIESESREDALLVLLNADSEPALFTLPKPKDSRGWKKILDTEDGLFSENGLACEGSYNLCGRSLVIFKPTL